MSPFSLLYLFFVVVLLVVVSLTRGHSEEREDSRLAILFSLLFQFLFAFEFSVFNFSLLYVYVCFILQHVAIDATNADLKHLFCIFVVLVYSPCSCFMFFAFFFSRFFPSNLLQIFTRKIRHSKDFF